MSILMAARAHDKQAIDGPYLQIKDIEGLQARGRSQRRTRLRRQMGPAPGQVEAANEVFRPARRTTTTPS